jgi:hypothetical protein
MMEPDLAPSLCRFGGGCVVIFPFRSWIWESDIGWEWAIGFFGAVIGLIILAIPWFFFLLNLQNLLQRIELRNRAMPAGHVWLNFIPIFNLGWFIYTVVKIRDSVLAEYATRGWIPERDQGYNIGLVTGVLAIASLIMGWVPVLGGGVAIAELVCWILYWLKTSEIKNRLRAPAAWSYGTSGANGGIGASGHAASHAGAGTYGRPDAYTTPQSPMQARGPAAPTQTPTAHPGPAAQPEPAVWPGPPVQPKPTVQPEPTVRDGFGEQPVTASRSPILGDVAGEAQKTPTVEPESSVMEKKRICAGCGTEYMAGDRFCRTCGLRLP